MTVLGRKSYIFMHAILFLPSRCLGHLVTDKGDSDKKLTTECLWLGLRKMTWTFHQCFGLTDMVGYRSRAHRWKNDNSALRISREALSIPQTAILVPCQTSHNFIPQSHNAFLCTSSHNAPPGTCLMHIVPSQVIHHVGCFMHVQLCHQKCTMSAVFTHESLSPCTSCLPAGPSPFFLQYLPAAAGGSNKSISTCDMPSLKVKSTHLKGQDATDLSPWPLT